MRIYPDTKVYIVCPGNCHTGGAELLHQLCSWLLAYGVDAYMVYFPENKNFNPKDPTDEFYKPYHVSHVNSVADERHNILVVYEGVTECLYQLKKIRRVLWWLSVDNYLICLSQRISQFRQDALKRPMPRFFLFDDSDTDIEHWVQSEYAREFIIMNRIPDDRIYPVEDYINQVFLNRAMQIDLSKKENIVAFNPKKGLEFTKKIIACAPDISWYPIQNMSLQEVQELLARAKCYIDFGYHPGRDRIPREAAASGCVVVTGCQGSAGNDVDVKIPKEFKFDEKFASVEDITSKIRDVLIDFDKAYQKQQGYRDEIMKDRKKFSEEVAYAFGIHLPVKQKHIGILDSGDGRSIESFGLTAKNNKAVHLAFVVCDSSLSGTVEDESGRKYLSVLHWKQVEVITTNDAMFLYQEGRIQQFFSTSSVRQLTNFIKEKLQLSTSDFWIGE